MMDVNLNFLPIPSLNFFFPQHHIPSLLTTAVAVKCITVLTVTVMGPRICFINAAVLTT